MSKYTVTGGAGPTGPTTDVSAAGAAFGLEPAVAIEGGLACYVAWARPDLAGS